MKSHMIIPLFIPHRGCPHRCSFCDQRRITGRNEVPDPTDIPDLLQTWLSTAGPEVKTRELSFFGGSFTLLPRGRIEAYLKAARPFLDSGDLTGLRCSTRPDALGPDVLDILKTGGVTTVEMGVQSLHDDILERARRGHDSRSAREADRRLQEAGFRRVIQLMVGLPGDTPERARNTARQVSRLKPEGVRLYPAIALENTGLGEIFLRGEWSPLSIDEAVEWCADMTDILTGADVPVIRTGLHPMRPGEESGILAGPYHASFGFLVRSRLARRNLSEKIRSFLKDKPAVKEITITLPARRQAEYIGPGRRNLLEIEEFWPEYLFRWSYTEESESPLLHA